MSTMSPEVAAVREEGLAAAREMLPASACPYAEGDWRRLDWGIGHTSFWRRPGARELKAANRARDRARARDRTAAERAARPPAFAPVRKRHVRACKLDGCGNRLSHRQRDYCCWEHYARSGALAESGRQGRAVADAKARARAAKPATPAPEPAAAPPPPAAVTPVPVTPEMWRAACTYMDPAEMRRFLGLDEAQVARVLGLQKRGGRIAA